MANTKDRVTRVVTGAHKALYRRTDGRVGGRIAGMPVLILTTRGRKTGKARTTVLGYLADGDRLVLVALRKSGTTRSICSCMHSWWGPAQYAGW